jgi:acetolactate synthase-1/2/3 large subunit
MIQWKQKAGGFADFGLKFGNPDFVMLAKSFGATGHLVKKADDLVKMITEAFSLGGVHLIEVPIDYSENQKVFDIELKEKTCEL